MYPNTEVETVKRISSGIISFESGHGISLSFAPSAKVGDRFAVTTDAATGEIIQVVKL